MRLPVPSRWPNHVGHQLEGGLRFSGTGHRGDHLAGLADPGSAPGGSDAFFDTGGTVLSALGLVLVVTGILAADNNLWLMTVMILGGALVLVWFFLSVRAKERAGKEPLLPTVLFRNRTSNLGLITQDTQRLLLTRVSFVVAAYLQVVRGYDAIERRR